MSDPDPAAPSSERCLRCQTVLPADTPAGLCPACLVSIHFGTGSDQTEPAANVAASPSIDDIAPHFPQLEILACLGRGGMGVVYRARQKSLGRIVALKLLAPERGSDPAFAERFAREAQALARLDHPHIVTIHDFGQAGGYYYLLMEYVDGVTLRQLVHGGRIAAREALAIVPQICDALQFAHDHGVVHRDIKPENILLDRRGQVKVADFGLAKLVGSNEETVAVEGDAAARSSDKVTAAGHVMGTPRYMAPEQRERPSEVDHRADIYALGVVLYQMLTGELPAERQLQPPSRRVRLDVRLDEIVLRALEKDPERRYSSATEFKTKLETFAAEDPPPEEPPRSPPPSAQVPPAAPTGLPAEEAHRAALEKLKPAATALIVTSALHLAGLLFGLLVGLGLLLFVPILGFGAAMSGPPTMNFFGWGFPFVGGLAGVALVLVVMWLLLNVAANILVISAARRMMSGRDLWLARTGAVVAIVLGALGLLSVAGTYRSLLLIGLWPALQLAAGIWAFVLLRKAEWQAVFSAPADAGKPAADSAAQGFATRAEPSEPRAAANSSAEAAAAAQRVAVPATGLLVAAAAQLLLLGLVLVVGLARLFSLRGGHGPTGVFLSLVTVLALFAAGLSSVFVLVCAARMRHLRGYGLAVCAAVLAIISFQGLLLGPIFGVWALVFLLRREVREGFDRPVFATRASKGGPAVAPESPPESHASAGRHVHAPATGLMIAAGLQLLVVGAALLFYLFLVHYRVEGSTGTIEVGPFGGYHYRSSTTPSFGPPKWYGFAPAFLAAGLLFPAFTFFAALRMRRLRNHGLAVCGALLAIMTLQGAGMGVLFGIWALAVLWRREVHRVFDAGRPGAPGRGCLYAVAVLTIVALVSAAGVTAMFLLVWPRTVSANASAFSPPRFPLMPPVSSLPGTVVLTANCGPVRTCTLPFAANDETALLDLERGVLVGVAGGATAFFENRTDVSGVYFTHNRATHELTFSGLSVDVTGLDRFGDGIWDDFSHVELRATIGKNLRDRAARVSTVVNDPGGISQPHTFLFKTRTGASGFLRVTRVERDPHQIYIEWKYFTDAPPVSHATPEDTERREIPGRQERPESTAVSRATALTTEQLEAGNPLLTEADGAALRALRQDLEKRIAVDLEANQGAPGPDYDYLSLWIARIGAELERRPTLLAPAPDIAAASSRRELEARLSAINNISQLSTRDGLLSVLAADAVSMGEIALARRALGAISDWQARDDATRGAALALKAAGRRGEALTIAQTISQLQVRDETLAEIGR